LEDVRSSLSDAVGDHVEVKELERADYDANGHPHDHEGGDHDHENGDSPPVIQDNPTGAGPFETLVNAVGFPKYDELDPTMVVFLTFPLFYGFMIGDVGYGILYAGIGYYIYANYDSPGLKSIGGVGIWAGIF
ncbi:MAG: V-type ATPase 116kDa subunit family protein, partial [Halobacteria archaeon]|nr:V-type ATPase 116kDa subunit family protein [Halobacteria archaeon]